MSRNSRRTATRLVAILVAIAAAACDTNRPVEPENADRMTASPRWGTPPVFTPAHETVKTGGVPIVAIWPNTIIMFELTMLFAILATVIALFITAKLPGQRSRIYDPEISMATSPSASKTRASRSRNN